MDRTEHTERMEHGRQSSQIRRRPPVRAAGGKAPGKPFKLNYRLMLCIAVLACFVLALLFFILFMVRGGKIGGLNEQVDALNKEKETLTAQVGALTQENQSMLASLTASLDDPTTAQTTSIADLIPQLTEGVYVVYSTGSQLQYLSVPAGYMQDRLAAYRDDSASFVPAQGDTPACTYYVLFSDRVIGLAENNMGFVSMDRSATGNAASIPAGMYEFVAAMFA